MWILWRETCIVVSLFTFLVQNLKTTLGPPQAGWIQNEGDISASSISFEIRHGSSWIIVAQPIGSSAHAQGGQVKAYNMYISYIYIYVCNQQLLDAWRSSSEMVSLDASLSRHSSAAGKPITRVQNPPCRQKLMYILCGWMDVVYTAF